MACTAHDNTTLCTGHVATAICLAHSIGPCTTHDNTTTCTAHVALGDDALPGTSTTWTDDPLTTSIKIKEIHHNELRNAIDAELNRRSISWPSDPGLVNISTKVLSQHVRKLRDGIDAAQTWSYPSYINDSNTEIGDRVIKDQYNVLRSQINSCETGCTCDCNYGCTCQCNYACTCQCNYACTCQCNYACTCQCNYACTCQCNYACTCQCNYSCTCDCNYTCTCNCAYSDRRLKTKIKYM